MDLLALLEQSWPIFFFQFLLSQDELHISCCVVGFAVLHINLSKKFKLNMVGRFLGVRVTGESKTGWFQVDVNLGCIRS